ncbi:unnamed protein product, partial [Prorocentrum cordatum]
PPAPPPSGSRCPARGRVPRSRSPNRESGPRVYTSCAPPSRRWPRRRAAPPPGWRCAARCRGRRTRATSAGFRAAAAENASPARAAGRPGGSAPAPPSPADPDGRRHRGPRRRRDVAGPRHRRRAGGNRGRRGRRGVPAAQPGPPGALPG